MVVAIPNFTLRIVGTVDDMAVPSNTVDTTVICFVFPAEGGETANVIDAVSVINAQARFLGFGANFHAWGQ